MPPASSFCCKAGNGVFGLIKIVVVCSRLDSLVFGGLLHLLVMCVAVFIIPKIFSSATARGAARGAFGCRGTDSLFGSLLYCFIVADLFIQSGGIILGLLVLPLASLFVGLLTEEE